jgi:transposase InsO family protein
MPALEGVATKKAVARSLGIARSTLYYRPKKPPKDWLLKTRIEDVLHEHPAYGHKRLALALKINKKRIRRVMNLFGLKPYRRRSKRPWKRPAKGIAPYPNLLLANWPSHPNAIWASDFTHIRFRARWLYLATTVDLWSRVVVGFRLRTRHTTDLVLGAIDDALRSHPPPGIHHSDQGVEYRSKRYVSYVERLGAAISMSRKGCPWENGYQESFYSHFKLDLGDPNRFAHPGELVAEIYRLIHAYNHTRIHSKLKMPPAEYAARHEKQLKGRIPLLD